MIGRNGKSISYDYDNRATSITGESSTVTNIYDYSGQRIKKTAGSSTTIYIGKLYECNNGVCTKHIFAGSTRIASKKITDTDTLYYHTDHLGSSTVITKQDGTIAQETYYYPFGETRYNSGDATNYKYTGQEEDPETGLYYYGARYYDPIIGRFITADSIVPEPFNPQALNRYSYVLNNPLKYVDPTGHFGVTEIIIVVVTIVVGWIADELGADVNVQTSVSVDTSGNVNVSTSGTTNDYGAGGRGSMAGNSAYPCAWGYGGTGINLTAISNIIGSAFIGEEDECSYDCRKPIRWLELEFINWGSTSSSSGGWFGGAKDYITNWAGENYAQGNTFAGNVGAGAATAIDVFLPQSWSDVPFMFMGNMKVLKEAHHLLPQVKRFAPFFKRAGLDIEAFTVDMAKDTHRLLPNGIHTGPNNWNKAWKEYFKKNPNASPEEIKQHLELMKKQFNIP
jgi:RHS repeat-associated protein